MKMKEFNAIVLIMVLFASCGYSATIGNWQGAADGDANHPKGTGSWKDAYWNKPPTVLPTPTRDLYGEIKIVKANGVCVLDSNGGNYQCILSISGGTDAATAARLEIVKGGYLGMGEVRVGSGGSAKTGAAGCVIQTGGTLNLTDNLIVGRAGSSDNNPNNGTGFYTISGGTITFAATNDKASLYIAGIGKTGPTEGTFTVVGKGANINFKSLFVGSNGKKDEGTGTVEFKIDAGGVSPIRLENMATIDALGTESTAKLVVIAIGAPPKSDILLIETLGGNPVSGVFDTVNGNPAAEGAQVVLKATDGSYYYDLTYTGGNGANDIMLKYRKFEPAAAAPAAAEPNK
ncbi:MAG: hypothetical protein WC496_12635 [Phycisphaerae bacterium]|jgi:hypothetical protein